ncbi:MAG: cytochrome c [Rhodobacteraceae bacterium]|nr:cytochrome c [Paracoccaceae bacterium]
MSIMKKTILLTAAFGIAASVAFAGGHSASPESKAIKARQAQMTLYSFNLGILGAMAKGDREFDAEAANLAAGNLAAISAVWMPETWIPGSDNQSAKGTDALPALWTDDPAKVGAKSQALVEASAALAKVSGTLDGLRGAIGPVGKSCGSCHEAYRAKSE